jgi:predicted PurR-regulated permease PerM
MSNSGIRNPGNFVPGIRGRNRQVAILFPSSTVVLIIASLYWAQAVLIPIAVSILLTFLLSPVAESLERLGLGRVFSVVLIVILAFSFLAAVGWIVTLQLTSVANELPIYRKISNKNSRHPGAVKEGRRKLKDNEQEEGTRKKDELESATETPRGCRSRGAVINVLASYRHCAYV